MIEASENMRQLDEEDRAKLKKYFGKEVESWTEVGGMAQWILEIDDRVSELEGKKDE